MTLKKQRHEKVRPNQVRDDNSNAICNIWEKELAMYFTSLLYKNVCIMLKWRIYIYIYIYSSKDVVCGPCW